MKLESANLKRKNRPNDRLDQQVGCNPLLCGAKTQTNGPSFQPSLRSGLPMAQAITL